MDDKSARALVESLLAPGEALVWAEAAPASNPAAIVHFLLTISLIGIAIGAFWYAIQLWAVFLPATRAHSKLLYKSLSFAALGLVSAALACIVLLSAGAALLNGFKVLSGGAAAYAVTERRALLVYAVSGAPYAEPLTLDLLRIDRDGDDLRLNQPLSTELFGVTFEPVFYDLQDAAAVERMIRALALERKPTRSANAPSAASSPDAGTISALAHVLYADETVLWAQRAEGRPYWLHETLTAGLVGFFGLLLLAGAVLPNTRWSDGSDAKGLRLIIGPIGLALTLWALSSAGWSLGSGHIYYAVTDRRLVVAHTEPWLDVREFGPWYFDHVTTRQRGISFCSRAGRRPCTNKYLPGVRDPETVAALLRDLYRTQGGEARRSSQ